MPLYKIQYEGAERMKEVERPLDIIQRSIMMGFLAFNSVTVFTIHSRKPNYCLSLTFKQVRKMDGWTCIA